MNSLDRSGLARLSDLMTPNWVSMFGALERQQDEFLALNPTRFAPGYRWPRDPLHTWSRVWEYPYTYHHLQTQRSRTLSGVLAKVADVGSGLTFFPFAVARLGFHVTATDPDPACVAGISAMSAALPGLPGSVDARQGDGVTLPFDDGEVDAVYCISVLEHLGRFEDLVSEIARVLKPGGPLILTVDLDLRGDRALSVPGRARLMEVLHTSFSYLHGESSLHPADLLTSDNGPYPVRNIGWLARVAFTFKQYAIKPVLLRRPYPLWPYRLAVEGFVLRRRPLTG